jgi:hypothetical protein
VNYAPDSVGERRSQCHICHMRLLTGSKLAQIRRPSSRLSRQQFESLTASSAVFPFFFGTETSFPLPAWPGSSALIRSSTKEIKSSGKLKGKRDIQTDGGKMRNKSLFFYSIDQQDRARTSEATTVDSLRAIFGRTWTLTCLRGASSILRPPLQIQIKN